MAINTRKLKKSAKVRRAFSIDIHENSKTHTRSIIYCHSRTYQSRRLGRWTYPETKSLEPDTAVTINKYLWSTFVVVINYEFFQTQDTCELQASIAETLISGHDKR